MFRRPFLRAKRRRRPPSRRRYSHLAVEALEDRRLLAVVEVTNTNDDVDGDVTSIANLIGDPGADATISLREAIIAANGTPNVGTPDEIHFEIPGAGPHVIQPNGLGFGLGLPSITDPVIIDGYTQTGTFVNTASTDQAITATLLIHIDGSLTFGQNGLEIEATGGGSTIRGLVISNFGFNGVSIVDSDDNIVIGNFLGTDPGGTIDQGNGEFGVYVTGGANNRVGGTAPEDRNLISGSTLGGVGFDLDSDGNFVFGNFIGTTFTGQTALGSDQSGVIIQFGSGGNTIGGIATGAGNLISGNMQAGIEIRDAMSDGNTVQGNLIGTDRTGKGDLGNGGDGIVIFNGAVDNLIGGPLDGALNLIAFNNDGVAVEGATSVGNAIQRNSIFENDDLGIDLADDGFTANDPPPPALLTDDDEGPNRLQNFPVLSGATLVGNSIAVTYFVRTDPSNGTYPLSVEFFVADASANRQGKTFLATDMYDSATGEEKFVILPAPAAFATPEIVATATDADGNTSEFSIPVVINVPVVLGSEPTLIRYDSITGDEVDFYQYRAHSTGKLSVRIDFIHAFGDLDLEVRDRFGNLIAESFSSSPDQNFEEIIIPVVAQESYFINVSGNGLGSDDTVDYSLEIENFPAPVPTAVLLDPLSDTGRLNNDNRTTDRTPTFFISADVLNFVDTNKNGFFDDPDDFVSPFADAIDALADDEIGDPGAAVEVTLINTTNPAQSPIIGFANPLIPDFPTLYVFTPDDPLLDGVYIVTAATRIWDGQETPEGEPNPATGRSNMSPPLLFTLDTLKPSVFFGEAPSAIDGIDPPSDTGVPSQPATIIDRITGDSTPTLWGAAEANATVRVFVLNAMGARVLIGETVATPFNGNNPSASGRWILTSTIDMNDPSLGFADLDGLRQFEIEAEDVAGNLSAGAVFNFTPVPQAINDDATTDYTLNVSGLAGPITDLNVSLSILHDFDEDLDVFLISPGGVVTVELFSDVGGTDDNFIGTTLDDEAATAITAGAAPFTGSFRPAGLLSDFDGLDPNGIWTLRIVDDDALISGTLEAWTLCFQQTLTALIDTQGPRVDDLIVARFPDFDLLGEKGSGNPPPVGGPTPPVDQLVIRFTDQPVRVNGFVYPAVNLIQADVPGNYRLVGDRVGIVPIVDVIVVDNSASGGPGMTDVALVFASPLPDDRYTLTVFDNLRDDAGNRLDGEFAGNPTPLPSGDGVPGGDFVVQFTVDALPELGVWAAGTVLIDANGNFISDGGFSAGDLAFHLGFSSDYIVAGNFLDPDDGGPADGFDKLAAYGRVGSQWRWLIDFTNDGVPDDAFNESAINGIPLAGNFDGDAANGDEIGLYTGSTWFFDRDHDYNVGDNASFAGFYQGFPFAGDFDGDGDDDVGTYIASQSGGNLFSIDLNTAGAGVPISIDGVADFTFRVGLPGLGAPAGFFGFPGVRERPVAADMNGDGLDDVGLWVPDGTALVPGDQGEWFFLVSDVETTILDRIASGFVSFTPTPFGNDIYAQFGNSFALPVVGNFDPPAAPGAAPVANRTTSSNASPATSFTNSNSAAESAVAVAIAVSMPATAQNTVTIPSVTPIAAAAALSEPAAPSLSGEAQAAEAKSTKTLTRKAARTNSATVRSAPTTANVAATSTAVKNATKVATPAPATTTSQPATLPTSTAQSVSAPPVWNAKSTAGKTNAATPVENVIIVAVASAPTTSTVQTVAVSAASPSSEEGTNAKWAAISDTSQSARSTAFANAGGSPTSQRKVVTRNAMMNASRASRIHPALLDAAFADAERAKEKPSSAINCGGDGDVDAVNDAAVEEAFAGAL
jgi:subtilisin-like proprotein convertase family protein